MKLKTFYILISFLWLIGNTVPVFSDENPDTKLSDASLTQKEAIKQPEIFFPEPVYQFKNISDGKTILHEFVVQNKGLGPLKIEQVRPG